MTEIERVAITRQADVLTKTFGIEAVLSRESGGRWLTPYVVDEINEHLRIMAIHSRKKWSNAAVTALLFFNFQLPESKAEPRAKAEAQGGTV